MWTNGKFVVHLWEKTSDVVVLEDGREMKRDEVAREVVGEAAPVQRGGEVSLPGRRTAWQRRSGRRRG